MTPQEFINRINRASAELQRVARHVMPTKAGELATAHFKQNFLKGGFVNNGLHPWKKAKRQTNDKAASAQYRTLLSGRNHLFSNTNYTPGDAQVLIYNDTPYAAIHNQGGTISIPAQQRVVAFSHKGRFTRNDQGARMAQKVNRAAHTVNMPQRQFIGQSKELTTLIENKWDEENRKVLRM